MIPHKLILWIAALPRLSARFSDFTDFGKVGACKNCAREFRGSTILRYKYRAPVFGSVQIVWTRRNARMRVCRLENSRWTA